MAPFPPHPVLNRRLVVAEEGGSEAEERLLAAMPFRVDAADATDAALPDPAATKDAL